MMSVGDHYTIHGDGTVTDTTTGLMWEYDPPKKRRTWDAARGYCEVLRLGGHTDWRMPTIHELFSLVDFSRRGPACALPTAADYYWSSSTFATIPFDAWYVLFGDGFVDVGYEGGSGCVRAVRGGPGRLVSTLQPTRLVVRAIQTSALHHEPANLRMDVRTQRPVRTMGGVNV